MALSKNTKDHDEIRQWAESRGAVPSEVASTHSDEKFEENNLCLVYQDKTASGRKSNFNKLVHEDSVESNNSGKKKSSSSKALSKEYKSQRGA